MNAHRQQSVWIIMQDGGYDGDAPCDAELRPLYGEGIIAGFKSEEEAYGYIGGYNLRAKAMHGGRFDGYVMEVGIL